MISGGRLDGDLRARLNGSLHTQFWSLVVGGSCALLTLWTCFYFTGHFGLYWLALALSVITIVRLCVTVFHDRGVGPDTLARINTFYPIAAFAFAACVGLMASTVLMISASGMVQVLAMTYSMTYVSGISIRSAGRPVVALGQMAITTAPILAALLTMDTFIGYLLAIIIPCMVAGMAAVTINLFRTMTVQANLSDDFRKMAETVERQAHEDPITGLVNRAGLDVAVKQLTAKLNHGEQLALIWIDLHRFKAVNDTMGHAAGDLMLREMGRRLRTAMPEHATVARFCSDEFVVATRIAGRRAAERLCRQISEHLAHPVRLQGQLIEGGGAIGVALMPEDEPTIDKLMQSADVALLNAKLGGRNQIRFFDNAMTHQLAHSKEIERDLRSAIHKDELSVFFQPIIDLESGRVRCFEALVRWFHPEKGELHPAEFIPIAEETGLIITLGNWVTAQAARAARSWPEDVKLAVNLSPVQIKAPGAALGILAAVKDAGLNPRRLELEVTESLFLEDNENTARFMQDLSFEGVQFALDDFGTGYSALHYINKYPFSKIKVDRSFVSGPNHGPRSDAIIRAVAEMGSTLGMEIVAEGLETIEQVQFVKRAGCTLGQGYFFSRAVPDYLATMLLAEEEERLEGKRYAS